MANRIAYVQGGGFGVRTAPLLHQPGLRSDKILSADERDLRPFNHNAYYAVAKPVCPYFGVSLSEPLIKRTVAAGIADLRITLHNLPETVIDYYQGRSIGGVSVKKFLYETKPLDTSGGIVRDVVADIKDGFIKPQDTILIIAGDIRADIDIAEFLGQHDSKQADISIVLANVPRDEMFRFGAALREGDSTPTLGEIIMKIKGAEQHFPVYGKLNLNPEVMARIVKFYEKAPKLNPQMVTNPGELIVQDILAKYGVGALAPTTLQNASIYAIRAELIYQLAPLVFNLNREVHSSCWRDTLNINDSGNSKFSDFGGDWFMRLTGSKPMPDVNAYSPTGELQKKIIEDLAGAPPQVFGFKMSGRWSDDGTLPSILAGHFEILEDLATNGEKSSWPIAWEKVRRDMPHGIISMSNIGAMLKEITLIPPVFIEDQVIINSGAVIGPYAIIGRGWEVAGNISRSVLFPQKRIDRQIEGDRKWKRFFVPAKLRIERSLIGSGFESVAIDHLGIPVVLEHIKDAVMVSNGSQNVVSPIDI